MWFNTFFPWWNPTNLQGKKLHKFENNIEFMNTFFNLLNLALYSFSFNNLPKTCNERWFKMSLIFYGYAALINDKELGYLSLGVRPSSFRYNIYGDVSEIHAFGWNGFNKQYTAYMIGSDNKDAESVICRDNDCMYPLISTIIAYSTRLCDTMRTLDVTAKKLKTPYFITCDESQKTSVKKILEDVDFNQDGIICNRSTMPNEFQVLNTGVNPQSVTTLWAHYNNLQSEIRTRLGINNATQLDKKERLIVDEVNSNDILTDLNLDYRMKKYKEFCEIVNELWNLDISVTNNIEIIENKNEKNENNFNSNEEVKENETDTRQKV